jgi:predicted RNA-binding Zn ribbon-like protein
MDFSHYSDQPAELAAALVNTEQRSRDEIADLEGLTEFLAAHQPLWAGVSRPARSGDVKAVQELRSSLREVFSAPDEETAAKLVNSILAERGAVPRVSVHSGEPHLHFEPLNSTMASWLGATTAMGLASVLVDHGIERFGICNATDCDDVYVDTSRNRSRLHCSGTCSTREAVAAYRKRQAN